MSSGFNIENPATGGIVAGWDPNGNIWTSGTITGVGYQLSGTGTVGSMTFNGIIDQNNGINTSGSVNVLSTLLIAPQQTSGTQIGDTSRDYDCYVVCVGGGTNNTLTIGSTSAGTSATVFAAATMSTGTNANFKLPAGWYIKFNGTGTWGVQQGVSA